MHVSVLLKESLEWLAPEPDGWWIDATVGGGGHTEALLEAIAPNGKVLGIDRDGDVLINTRNKLERYQDRLLLVQGNFRNMVALAAEHNVSQVRGILMDLGVSSFQLDDGSRGFSFQNQGPLDMRMDRQQELTAEYLINHADEQTLATIFFEYGEERRSRKLANWVLRNRPIADTESFAKLAKKAVGPSGKIHPATRAFQALRIAVNDELESLKDGLKAAELLLADQGRLVVISFHSLEDRIVKHWMRQQGWERLIKRVVVADENEKLKNPRARSAKLRAAKRVNEVKR